jgi:hypothetical protein
MSTALTIQQVIAKFNSEFSIISSKFKILDLDMDGAKSNQGGDLAKPGVYVFWDPSHGVIKVGRSLDNSHKRSFEHIRDNTKGGSPTFEMKTLPADAKAHLILFNVPNPKDYHWVAAVEIFLEDNLNPYIKTARTG